MTFPVCPVEQCEYQHGEKEIYDDPDPSLIQSAQSMLAQANQLPQGVLQLLG